jgi:hypothetical protein
MRKTPSGSVRMPGKAKPKAKVTSRASKPRKSASKSKGPPRAGAKAKTGASEAKLIKVRKGEKIDAVLSGGNPRIRKTAGMRSHEQATGEPASRLIDQREPGEWRGETLARMRALILEADPEMIEERKWRKPSNGMAGVPVWSHHGIVCTGETYTKVVKLTFARGASVPDPSRLFNSSLEGNTRRAIDIHEGEEVDAAAFKALVKAAVAQNSPPAKKRQP